MTEKFCPSCKQTKPVEQFNHSKRTKDGYDYRCKECQKASNKKWCEANWSNKMKQQNERVRDIAEKIANIKTSQGCLICGEETACCLDFHHLDPKSKEINPACMISNGWGWSRIENELNKCVIVCANCHRKIHAGLIQWPVGKTANPSHCHCEDNRGSTGTGRH